MSGLEPGGFTLPARRRRQAFPLGDPAIAVIEHQTMVEVAGVRRDVIVQSAKVDGIYHVARSAMHAVALLSETEHQLGLICPLAVGRLEVIGNVASMSLAEVVMDTGREF